MTDLIVLIGVYGMLASMVMITITMIFDYKYYKQKNIPKVHLTRSILFIFLLATFIFIIIPLYPLFLFVNINIKIRIALILLIIPTYGSYIHYKQYKEYSKKKDIPYLNE